jgi:hypothetical protein
MNWFKQILPPVSFPDQLIYISKERNILSYNEINLKCTLSHGNSSKWVILLNLKAW